MIASRRTFFIFKYLKIEVEIKKILTKTMAELGPAQPQLVIG